MSNNITIFRQEYGLGRLEAEDPNDRNYPMSSLLPTRLSTRTSRYWYAYTHHLNQGAFPHCVGYSLAHYLLDAPITKGITLEPSHIYYEAQRNDEWPGEDYDGTSVRAGAKVLQSWGYISNYFWAFNTDTITKTLLNIGPVVVGTYWYEMMFQPNSNHIITPTGQNYGGHAYVLNGVNTKSGYYRLKNSWGKWYGKNGHAYIKIEDFATLLSQSGEALIATEAKR